MKLSMVHDNCQLLETKLAEKENIISENGKLISNFQKEVGSLTLLSWRQLGQGH